ncbi:MAG: PstS family phosphate ABC transporter substrate-binding protein [Halanaeroarchaeum sp.]
MSDQTGSGERMSRRKLLASAGVAGAAAVAGCSGGSESTKPTTESGSDLESPEILKGGGSSTVFPIANVAKNYWNRDPAAGSRYWNPAEYGIDTEKNLADYFGSLYGFQSDGSERSPPFEVTVSLSHSGTGLEKLRKGQLDLGNSSAPVAAELSDASESTLDNFTNHVVGVDAQPLVVSREIYDAGVTQVTIENLRAIYKGEIDNWSALGGPDEKIQVVGRAKGSGTSTAFRLNVFGDPTAATPGVDVRKGQNQQAQSLVAQSSNAIAYLALKFVKPDGQVPPIDLKIGDTVYAYGKNLDSKEYPLSRDLHSYTWKGTTRDEAAFLHMILTRYGQDTFVASNDYLTLSDERLQAQREKLPDV